jgi:protein-S-isoprenylcysteine O-methyltransferase Ste14
MENDPKAFFFNGITLLVSVFVLFSGPLLASTLLHLLIQVLGVLIILWAILARRANKTKEASALPSGYFFITKGPYEIIRHPIYAGYLVFMLSLVEDDPTFLRFIAILVLLGMIMIKIVREEQVMLKEVKTYQTYKVKTKAIIPYLL